MNQIDAGRSPHTVIRRWGEMIKFSHSIFALPFALVATFLAARAAYRVGAAPAPHPSPVQVILIVGCMVAARSVAMTFNRIVDARIDARNPRTAGRAIPAGTITLRQASLFLAAASAMFVVFCGGFWITQHNIWPLVFSMPVLLYLCFYSYTKRFTRWSHLVLGSAIGLSPPAAWVAIHPASFGWEAVLLVGVVMLWIGGFDILYACQDIDSDRRDGLHSLPASLGPARALRIARLAHAGTVVLLVLLGQVAGLGWLYAAGVAGVAVLLLVEHLLVRADDFSRINVAFFTVNGIIGVALAGLTIADVLIHPWPALP